MNAKESYAEALRLIRKAEKNGEVRLDLSELKLIRLPPELASLTSLQSLKLSKWVSGNLSPLTHLTSLQSLDLYECEDLSGDLSPLASLTSLQSLDLSGCEQLYGDLSPLADLTSLESLYLTMCLDLSGDLSPLAGLTSLRSLHTSPGAIGSATCPRWPASPRSDRSTCLTVTAFAGLPHSNHCYLG